MRSSKPWLVAVAFLLVSAFSASSALATGYFRGFVKPSGDGLDCSIAGNGFPCVGGDGNSLTVGTVVPIDPSDPSAGNKTVFTSYNAFGFTVVPGTTVTFTFSSLPGSNDFAIIGCGIDSSGNPGIFTSDGTNLGVPCGLLGGTVLETDDSTNGTISLLFKGPNLSSTWGIGELTTGPQLLSLTETFAPVATPEPASISLLAIGLVGLGLLRRKRAA